MSQGLSGVLVSARLSSSGFGKNSPNPIRGPSKLILPLDVALLNPIVSNIFVAAPVYPSYNPYDNASSCNSLNSTPTVGEFIGGGCRG